MGTQGHIPRHKTPDAIRERILALCRAKYAGFNDQHFTEKLAEAEGIPLSRQTVRRFLREAGIGSVRKRRPVTHRRRRDRRPQAGQMILWDGSRHDWLEGRGPRMRLMPAIDDATGEFLPGAHFVEQECSVGYLRVLRDIIVVKGIPLSAYMDLHGSLRRNDGNWTKEEQLAGRQEPTHVRRALDDLRVEVILRPEPTGQGKSRTPLGNAAGPACLRASPRRRERRAFRQQGSAQVPAAAQRTLRDSAAGRELRLAPLSPRADT